MSSPVEGTRKDEKIQKKTFGKWINAQLSERGIVVTDLYYDLRDGRVLLELLEVLTHRTYVKERGRLRVHHLGNAYTILSILKENKVKLVNINNVDLVDGNPKITLALVWSIIVHWQFKDVMRESLVKGASGLEKILLAWTVSATKDLLPEPVKDFGDSWRDGLALGALLARFRPDLLSWKDYVSISEPQERLEFILCLISRSLGVQRLLDPEDFLSTPDKKSLMMYVMCLYEALPSGSVPLEKSNLNSDSDCSLIGSPFKTPVKISEEGLKYEVYTPIHEDMVEWLLDAEEKLNSMKKVSGDLPEIKQLFEEYKDYMEELNFNQVAVGEVLELGSKLIDDPRLTPYQEKDVRVRVKVLSDKWEELRVLAMNRQSEIFELVMVLQKDKMKQLREWMTRTEDRISRMGSIGLTLEEINKQMSEHLTLQKDLESQQTIVNSISNFIIADIGEGKSDGSGNSEQELEDQVTALGERWIHLCVWIEERWSALKDASALWKHLMEEKEVLHSWLEDSMITLKEVERTPTENMKELMVQVKLIANIHEEVVSYQKRLSSLERVVDSLCLRYESNPSICEDLGKNLEFLQDRWEILTDILEAQKQRISSLGLTIENYFESPSSKKNKNKSINSHHSGSNRNGSLTSESVLSMASKSNEESSSSLLEDEDSTPKKRKITGSQRIQFESCYAKLVAWLSPRLEPNYEISLEEENVSSIESEVSKTFDLGKELIRGIISEDDFPPDYLGNIRAKIRELESLWKAFDTKRMYSSLKCQFYSELNSLKKLLEVSQSLLESCDDIECLRAGREALDKHSGTLESIKKLSTEVTLCPGALQDPSSSVKADLYSFCDKWAIIESGFEAKEMELLKRGRLLKMREASAATQKELQQNGAPLVEDSLKSVEKLRLMYSEVEELEAWMNETEKLLSEGPCEDGSPRHHLPGLIEDLSALEKKLELINSNGLDLASSTGDESLEDYLKHTAERWSSLAGTLRARHNSFLQREESSRRRDEDVGEILTFLKNLQRDVDNVLSSQLELTKPVELSQRTFKLLHFKDRIEKKRSLYEELLKSLDPKDPRHSEVSQAWNSITGSILSRYNTMKTSSADYGEFKSLAAQESDWLERLEKKLRKSTLTTAADAEEISEALDDIENFIHNHSSGERLGRLEELSESLSRNGIKFDSVYAETKKLKARWEELSCRAKERTSLLEGHIAEAQEWEYKILSVQEWLSERDMLLSSHLEHELNVADLPEETQEAILREFEDHENLLSEMDEQVEAYREEGKSEAASRLEDQLNLIHSRFRELAMKFELFQRQSASEYSLRLDRVSRQLRDISSQLKLAELHSWDPADVSKQAEDATCIYNALSGIKPEVENVIKMGRVLVAENPSEEGNEELTSRIDALKNGFNQIGSQITDSRSVLEKALKLSEKLQVAMSNVESGLAPITDEKHKNEDELASYLKSKVSEMIKLKDDLRSILQIKSDLISLSLHGPIDEAFLVLQKRVDAIESRWRERVALLKKLHAQLSQTRKDVSSIPLSSLDFEKEDATPLLKEGNSPLLAEFKSAFQEVSARIEYVESRLFGQDEEQDNDLQERRNVMELGQEIESLRPEMSNLREMAIKLVVMFVGQKGGVEPEMRCLGQRWDEIVRSVEERLSANRDFNMVEVEEIKTTISHLRIPTPSSIMSSTSNTTTTTKKASSSLQLFSPDSEMDSEEIVTLPEDDEEITPASTPQIQSPVSKKEETKKIISSLSIIPSSNKRAITPTTTRAVTNSSTTSNKVKVKVSINTLPTPQKVVTSPVTINSQIRFRVPEQTYLASHSSSSSISTATLTESKNGGMDEDEEESAASLARDNEAIDKLLSDTHLHIQELKSKSSSYQSSRSSSSSSSGILEKEFLDFSVSKKNMLAKIGKAKGKVMDLDREGDLTLRLDYIEMESKIIEAEVATLISRGDTLVLMTHRNDVVKGESLQRDVAELREAWADLRSLCERKKVHASNLEKKLEDFKDSAEELKSWISSLKNKKDFRNSPSFARKKLEMESLNNLGSTLKRQNVLGVNALNLSLINSKWDEILQGGGSSTKSETSSSSKSPRSVPSDSQKEIVSILEKLIDAVSVISRQLSTHFLASPRVYENLLGQRKSLEIVRSAIERIGPTVRKTESELEGINGKDGGISVEYYDKILVLGETLRKNWMELNSKYQDRQGKWKDCSRKYEQFETELASANRHMASSSSQLSMKQKEIDKIIGNGKEILSQSSGEDAVRIQQQIDNLLKRWKELTKKESPPPFRKNKEEKEVVAKEKEVKSPVMSMKDTMDVLQRSVNVSSLSHVSNELQQLDTIHKNFQELKGGKPETIERLTPILSKKHSYLSEKKSRLEKFRHKIQETESWVEDMSRKLTDVSKQKMKGNRSSEVISRIRLAVIDKEYEVNRLLSEYMMIEREVPWNEGLDPELHKLMDDLKVKWKKLTSESRRISAEGSSRESSPLVKRNNKSSESSLKETLSCGSMMSPSSELPLSTANSSMTNDSVASGTTFVTSPLSEEVAPLTANIEPSMSELNIWLNSISSEISNSVAPVHDNESVKELINRLTFLLHDLEIKRPFIDDLYQSCMSLCRSENGKLLKERVGSLRDHWDSVKCHLLSRKTELMSMSPESDQFKRKNLEMRSSLGRIQERLSKCNRRSSTERPSSFEVMDTQIKSYLSLKKDLAKFHHQFLSFSSFCQRICSVYSKDDSSEIKAIEKSLLSEYETLESSISGNLASLQENKSRLTNYDSSVQKFLAWLSEIESHVEGLEGNEEKDPYKLSVVKNDISSKSSEFNSLLSTGESISNGMTSIESGMIRQRGEEMRSRLGALTLKVDILQGALAPKEEGSNPRVNERKNSRKDQNGASSSLEENLSSWIQRKRRELRSLSPALDLIGLGKQIEEHKVFESMTLEEKKAKWGTYEDQEEWLALLQDMKEWREKLQERRQGLRMFQSDFESLTSRLAAVEETRCSLWNEDSFLEALETPPSPPPSEEPQSSNNTSKSAPGDSPKSLSSGNKDSQMRRLEEALSSLEEGLSALKKQALRFSSQGQELSESTRSQLRVLEERIINLRNQLPNFKISSPATIKVTQKKTSSVVPQGTTTSSDLPSGWERGFTEDHIPYFLNHEDASTTWDHPVFSQLMESLKEINAVQYSVYRLALKLRKIQQKLCLDLLDIQAALIGFQELGLGPERHDDSLSVPEMSSVLTSLISAAHEENPEDVDVPLCSNLALNWILNVYDPGRSGSVRVFAFKVAVLIFTRGPLADKYKAFFDLLSHHNQDEEKSSSSLDPYRVGLLIHDCLQVPKVFGEIASFGGSNVEPSVRSCFTMDVEEPLATVDEEHFTKWLRREPQCLVWLPVLHRLAWAELAKHNTKCNVCKVHPMVGFRYLCLKCFNFDLCHNCFFLGKTTKSHSLDHPMKEFCTSTGASVNLKNFTASVRNSFRTKKYFKKKYKQLCYLPVSSVLEGEDFVIPPLSQTSTLESNKSLRSGESSEDDGRSPPGEEGVVPKYSPRIVNISSHGNQEGGDEEHSLISKYCQILFENNSECSVNNNNNKSEKVILDQIKAENRQCKRLEKRINLLESHNKQLEGHVQRLRELFSKEENDTNNNPGGTLNSKSITASDLTQSSNEFDTDSGENEEEEGETFRLDSPDSLNLSQHETTVISD